MQQQLARSTQIYQKQALAENDRGKKLDLALNMILQPQKHLANLVLPRKLP